jgi:antitoxin VapB
MAFHVRDVETDSLVRHLARKHHMGLTEAIRFAVGEQLRREDAAVPLKDRIAALRARVLQRPPTGLDADKTFYDELSGDL